MSQKGSRKSRSGCLACKSKRLKCDETKPQCVMCTSRQQQCPGYQQLLRWSNKHEARLTSSFNLSRFPNNIAFGHRADINDHMFIPSLDHFEIEGQTWQANTHGSISKSPEPCEPLDLSRSLFGNCFSANDAIDQRSIPLDTDVVLPELDLEQSFYWLGDNPGLDDFQSFDTTLGSDTEFYEHLASVTASTDPDNWNETGRIFLGEKEDRELEARIPHNPNHETGPQVVSQTGVRLYRSSVPQNLTHIPTLLIDYWFQTVCSTWNCFDSAKNFNRDVALRTFAHSQGLAYSLQSMAAMYLSEHLPQFRAIAISMTQAAVHAIRLELTQRTSPSALPEDLLLSMFCIGTSACWIDSLQFGLPFLKEVKAIIRAYRPLKAGLALPDQKALVFFDRSSMYWEMLCSIIGAQRDDAMETLSTFPSFSLPILEEHDVLHPWTGVSTGIVMLFFESILVCRRFRLRVTHKYPQTSQSLRAALDDIDQAWKLHHRLEIFPIPNEQDIAETEDVLTPISHLVEIAEAYRLAALAHLRQTFPDLVKERTSSDGATAIDTYHHVLGLGLEIIRKLESIPLTSGTRCLQPLLCLTAGIALKADPIVVKPQRDIPTLLNDILSTDLRSSLTPTLYNEQMREIQLDASAFLESAGRSIEVGQARRFVLGRFSVLENTLPSNPVRVAKQLVQTVWAAYDNEEPSNSQVHWINIMAQSNLRTIFG